MYYCICRKLTAKGNTHLPCVISEWAQKQGQHHQNKKNCFSTQRHTQILCSTLSEIKEDGLAYLMDYFLKCNKVISLSYKKVKKKNEELVEQEERQTEIINLLVP